MLYLKAGTIIFQSLKKQESFHCAVNASSRFEQSTALTCTINHVGLYVGNDSVIEATRGYGVIERTLSNFLSDGCYHLAAIIKDSALAKLAMTKAYGYLGLPYNHSFEPNGAGLYCSELIIEAFSYPNGQHYFQLYPMNFGDIVTKQILPYWIEYYRSLGRVIPQGTLGSNPQQLLRQTSLYDSVFPIIR
ncbi:permuted papain-like amidase YaeF/Yiix C92 family enzyme [Orbus hercynius]|uniref:Permuted papain-like amidase YaeF/Yiix C92 family enzyme n=1 Tax=Orbus hercynius TaxID=593135 RepID=A0A495REZ6_9GAMM|nr:YiiX/YebB-like N1pC/P60 family cysteine hydrolase [Orbus hercynius]RKS85951.1 permuted papain-like amidase YaeF/Yiix C92 family enzyme [Orbus hercynius]